MSKLSLFLVCAMCVLPLNAATYHSSDFGWKADQDVTQDLTKLLEDGGLKAGDELVLDTTYRIDIMSKNKRTLPASFTLSAVKGAGFDVYGFSQLSTPPNPVLDLGDGNTLRNVTINCEGVPTKIVAPKRQAKYFSGTAIYANGKKDILIENCRLSGLMGHNIHVAACRRLEIIGCQIVGGYWSVYLADVTDAVFRRCLFEKSTCDGIKTGGGGKACRNIVVEACVFQDNTGGDGIDTTGGFNDSIVRNCIFRRLGTSGMDIKSHYESKTGKLEELEPENVGILIENCTFHDMPNGIVLTTLDCGRRFGPGHELLHAGDMQKYAPHDININDCVFGYAEKPLRTAKQGGYGCNFPSEDGEHMRAILLKDAYGIRYRNAQHCRERMRFLHIHSIGGGGHLSKECAEAIDHSITGNILDEPVPPIKPGVTEVSFACGPQDVD